MARQKKEGESRTFKLKVEILEQIDRLSEETMLSKTAIVEKALTEFFDRLEDKSKSATSSGKKR